MYVCVHKLMSGVRDKTANIAYFVQEQGQSKQQREVNYKESKLKKTLKKGKSAKDRELEKECM